MSVKIPNKSSFKLEEICALTGIKPYILRFWESEFDEIRPITSASGQKIYEHKDIANVLKIKDLLVSKKLSVEKAKKFLAQEGQSEQEERKRLPQKQLTTHEGPPEISLDRQTLQSLVLAKAKLQSIISKTQSVQGQLNGF